MICHMYIIVFACFGLINRKNDLIQTIILQLQCNRKLTLQMIFITQHLVDY